MDILQSIEINAEVMMGKPIIKGTRITVELILEKISGGETVEDILLAHPHITRENIQAALAFAANNLKTDTSFPLSIQHEVVADESVDAPIVYELRKNGHQVFSIAEELAGIKDESVLKIAYERKRILITQDKDFGELVFKLDRSQEGVILLRLTGLSPFN